MKIAQFQHFFSKNRASIVALTKPNVFSNTNQPYGVSSLTTINLNPKLKRVHKFDPCHMLLLDLYRQSL